MIIVVNFGAEHALLGERKLSLLNLDWLFLFGELFRKGTVTYLVDSWLDLGWSWHDSCAGMDKESFLIFPCYEFGQVLESTLEFISWVARPRLNLTGSRVDQALESTRRVVWLILEFISLTCIVTWMVGDEIRNMTLTNIFNS